MSDGQSHSVLVRACAIPVRYWLMAASSDLFGMIDALNIQTSEAKACYQRLAAEIGDQLVPIPTMDRDDRAFLLGVRRNLHSGRGIDAEAAARAIAMARAAGADVIASSLVRCLKRGQELARLSDCIDETLASETERLQLLPALITADSPVARMILDDLGPPPAAPSPAKKKRRFFERSWRHVTRSATDPTPRGWMCHVGLLGVAEASDEPGRPPSMTTAAAVHRTESVRAKRRDANEVPGPGHWDETETVGANPLCWSEAGEHVSVILDRGDEPSCVVMQETGMLRAVLASAAHGPRTLQQICADIGDGEAAGVGEVRPFLTHLCSTGVLERCATPDSALTRVEIGSPHNGPSRTAQPDNGWIDVYRGMESTLPEHDHRDLQERLPLVLRILRQFDPMYRSANRRSGISRSWSFTQALQDSLARQMAEPPTDATSGRPAAMTDTPAGAPLGDLLEGLLAGGHDAAAKVINLSPDRIEAFDTDAPALAWPVDVVVRLAAASAPYRYIVRGVWPAGTIDSRFSEGLRLAFGAAPSTDAYRGFLRQIEARTDIRFVELLAPPLSGRADNAVRRPAYASAWTGDPNCGLYLAGPRTVDFYVSPRDIEFHSGPDGLRAQANGRRIWPVYHATRSFSPPWDQISRVLLASAPLSVPASYRRPSILIKGRQLIERGPRIVVDGDIVLCPAHWLIGADALWAADAPPLRKIQSLAQLRRQFGLPRWVEISDPLGVDYVACDLDSIDAIQALERALHRHDSIRVTEMLPTPDQLLLGDRAHRGSDRVISEIVVRLPGPERISALADQVAREVEAS